MTDKSQPASADLIEQGFSEKIVGAFRSSIERVDGVLQITPLPLEPGLPLLVGEAPGATEDETGIPFHPEAEAGGLLHRLMYRVRLKHEQFNIVNCVMQRPPNNRLYNDDGEPLCYTQEAIDYWKPFLHKLIDELKPPVIIGLGKTALSVLTGFGEIGKTRGYVHHGRVSIALGEESFDPEAWDQGLSERSYDLNIPVTCTYHPSGLNHGQMHLCGVFLRDLLNGFEIGKSGWHPPKLRVKPNPSVDEFKWFCSQFNPERHVLTYDIENPETRGLDEDEIEDELGKKEISYEIDRMSFCFDSTIGGYSVPFAEPYISIAKSLLTSCRVTRGHNVRLHDRPRLVSKGFSLNGREEDTLELWRHLHRTLPASVAYIAPFYLSISPWKQESHTQPEWYSAMDAICQHHIGEGIERDLRSSGQWEMAQRHVIEVIGLAEQMARNGLPYLEAKAREFQLELEQEKQWCMDGRPEMDGQPAKRGLQELVPEHLKPLKQKDGLKRTPTCVAELLGEDSLFSAGLAIKPSLTEVREKTGYVKRTFNIFTKTTKGTLPHKEERWALLLPFNPASHVQVKALFTHFNHKPKTDRKTKQTTSGDSTLKSLIVQYVNSDKPGDKQAVECYQLIRECRAIDKVLGTYVKGWKPGLDGLIHATPGLWGKMFRLSWRQPNLAATIVDKKEVQIAAGFRKCIACRNDEVLIESDWRSQEAVILGYYADDPNYIRLAKMSLNAYMASHLLNRPADLSWSDADLASYLKEIRNDKKNVKIYDDAKHTIYLIQNGGTPYLISEQYELPIKRAQFLYNFYFDLFPKIRALHKRILDDAYEKCYVSNEWGYRIAIWSAYDWNQKRLEKLRKLWLRFKTDKGNHYWTKDEQKWLDRIKNATSTCGNEDRAIRELCYDLGDEAKAALSFYPRDAGSAMLKDSMLALEDEYQWVSRGYGRASAHDSLIAVAPYGKVEEVAEQMCVIQERPVSKLGGLVIEVEQAFGLSWDKKGMVGELGKLKLEVIQ